MRIDGLKIFAEPQPVKLGEAEGMANQVNGNGDVLYVDLVNHGKGYFPEGSQPDGWTAHQVRRMVSNISQSRGTFRSIVISEKDADGNDLFSGVSGYADIEDITHADLVELLNDSPALRTLHENFVTAAIAYMREIYSQVK